MRLEIFALSLLISTSFFKSTRTASILARTSRISRILWISAPDDVVIEAAKSASDPGSLTLIFSISKESPSLKSGFKFTRSLIQSIIATE